VIGLWTVSGLRISAPAKGTVRLISSVWMEDAAERSEVVPPKYPS
jgi:hypothetical protein